MNTEKLQPAARLLFAHQAWLRMKRLERAILREVSDVTKLSYSTCGDLLDEAQSPQQLIDDAERLRGGNLRKYGKTSFDPKQHEIVLDRDCCYWTNVEEFTKQHASKRKAKNQRKSELKPQQE